MQPAVDPEIKRTSFLFTALHLLAVGVDNTDEFPFMDPPGAEDGVSKSLMQTSYEYRPEFLAAKAAIIQLGYLGAVTAKSHGKVAITALGRQMAKLPLEPRLARVLIESFEQACPKEAIDILSMLEHADTILINTIATRDAAMEAHGKFRRSEGDHFTLLNVLKAYDDISENPGEAKEWCRSNLVSAKAISNVLDTRKQLRQRCDQLGLIWDVSCGEATEPVLRSLAAGFSEQVAARKPDGSFEKIASRLVCLRVIGPILARADMQRRLAATQDTPVLRAQGAIRCRFLPLPRARESLFLSTTPSVLTSRMRRRFIPRRPMRGPAA